MNKRYFTVVVFFAVAVMVAGVAGTSGKHHLGIDAFAKRVAGTYIFQAELDQGIFLASLSTLSADGNVVFEDTSDVTNIPMIPAFQSAQRGTWKRTGKYEITAMTLGFDYDADRNFVSILRLTGKTTFAKDFNSSTSTGEGAVFFPWQNPLDPNEQPILEFTWEGGGQRIPAILN